MPSRDASASWALDVDPALRLHRVVPLDQVAREALAGAGAWFRALVLAGAIALLLTHAGIYAVVSFNVSRRTREIGLRVALGANRQKLVLTVVSMIARQVGIGVVTGSGLLIAFAALGGTWRPTLQDGALLVPYMGAMTLVCLLACVVPTWRALRIEHVPRRPSDVSAETPPDLDRPHDGSNVPSRLSRYLRSGASVVSEIAFS